MVQMALSKLAQLASMVVKNGTKNLKKIYTY